MNNYLFFRTDRIGDFLISAILIKSIKRNDLKSNIIVVSSKKNYAYIKSLDFIDEVFLYPDNFLKKIYLFKDLYKRKYALIAALDGKKRSIYFSIFFNSKIKVLMTTKSIFQTLFYFFFSKIYLFKKSKRKIDEFLDVLNLCKMTFRQEDLYFLNEQKITSKNINKINDYLLYHFDEKWINNSYIDKYKSIEPSQNEFELFVNRLIEKTKKNIIITTGVSSNKILNQFIKSFNKINNHLYEKICVDKKIHLYLDIDFFDLKFLIKNCDYLITCHGASTHVASALNKRIYDIYDLTQEEFYSKWTSHMTNYSYFFRDDFKKLTDKILANI